jgi:hypothetical protein
MSNCHAVKLRTVIWAGFAVVAGTVASLSPLTCSGLEPVDAERPTAKSDEKLSSPVPSRKSKSDAESEKESDDPFATAPPAKKAEVKPILTDPLAKSKSTDSKTPSKTTKHTDNPFEEKEPDRGSVDANLSEDQIETTIAKDPRFQQAVLELAGLVSKESEADKQGAGKSADPADARLREAVEGLRRNIEQAQKLQWQQALEQPGRVSQVSSANIPAGLVEHQLLEAQYNQITEQIAVKAKSVQEMERFNGEPEQLRSDIDELKGIVKDMGTTLMKRKIELDAAPRVSILQQASTPELGSPAHQYVAAGLGAFVGFLLVLISVAIVSLLFRKKTARDPGVGTIGEATPVRPTRWVKWTLTFCVALAAGGALGGLCWFLFPVKYESAGLVRVSIVDPAIWEPHAGIDFESFKLNMVEMIKSPPVVGKAVEDKTIQDFPIYRQNSADVVNWLSDALQITGGNSELIRVSLRNEDPTGLKEIIDAVLVAFTSEVIDRARTDKLNETDGLEKKFNAMKSQVIDKERQLYTLSQQIGTSDSQTARVQYRMQVDALDTLLLLRTDIQRRISDLEFKVSLAKALQDLKEKTNAPAADRDDPIATDQQAERKIWKLSKLLHQLKDTKKASGDRPTDSTSSRILADIASLQQRIDKISDADRQKVIERLKK